MGTRWTGGSRKTGGADRTRWTHRPGVAGASENEKYCGETSHCHCSFLLGGEDNSRIRRVGHPTQSKGGRKPKPARPLPYTGRIVLAFIAW